MNSYAICAQDTGAIKVNSEDTIEVSDMDQVFVKCETVDDVMKIIETVQ